MIYAQKQAGCKRCGPFQNIQCEKAVKLKGVAKKWLWWYMLMANFLMTTIQVNFLLIPSEVGMRQHTIAALNFLPSTYTITAISWLPPLILQLFHTGYFEQGCTFIYSQALFEYISDTQSLPCLLKASGNFLTN